MSKVAVDAKYKLIVEQQVTNQVLDLSRRNGPRKPSH